VIFSGRSAGVRLARPERHEVPRLSLPAAGRRLLVAGLALGAACLPRTLPAQQPTPDPTNERIGQDRADFRARTGLVVGSGARAYGMGGAFLARADDATAASWNPAGLSYLRRPEVSLAGVRESVNTNDGPTTFGSRRGNSPDFLSATYPVNFGPRSGAAQVSYQRVFSFAGTRTFTQAGTQFRANSRGGYDVLAMGTGLRLFRGFRVGATMNRWLNGYEQDLARGGNRKSVQTTEYQLRSGWNVNLGLIWEPSDSLNLGLVAKTPFTSRVRLTRTRDDCISSPTQPGDCDLDVTHNEYSRPDLRIDFPGAVGAGASWRLHSQLTVSLDYTRTFWSGSEIRRFYTLPRTERRQPPPRPEDVGELYGPLRYPTLSETPQVDTEQIRSGLEYVVLRGGLKLPLRVGYFSDRQHFREAGNVPRFNGFTVGAGIGVGPVLLDAAFVYETGSYPQEPTLGEDGALEVEVASIISRRVLVSLIYRHGSGR
jgi:long-subunit fatty acid transport protein